MTPEEFFQMYPPGSQFWGSPEEIKKVIYMHDQPIPPGGKAKKGVHIDLFKLDLCETCGTPLKDVQTIFIRQGSGYCKASCRPQLQVVAR